MDLGNQRIGHVDPYTIVVVVSRPKVSMVTFFKLAIEFFHFNWHCQWIQIQREFYKSNDPQTRIHLNVISVTLGSGLYLKRTLDFWHKIQREFIDNFPIGPIFFIFMRFRPNNRLTPRLGNPVFTAEFTVEKLEWERSCYHLTLCLSLSNRSSLPRPCTASSARRITSWRTRTPGTCTPWVSAAGAGTSLPRSSGTL